MAKTAILHIPIKREYFDAIRAGEKTEEYRAYSPFWISRLGVTDDEGQLADFRQYDIVRFRNGYEPDSPVMDVEFQGIILEEFMNEPEDSEYRFGFAIQLGKVLRTENV
ncbi:hypothetical protein [Neolewinella litorea]|uniref:ASCH domain-containing protein n=1 Tax=Neolewinella litorea TaxID=2562452 RepID=A0A4S4NI66_9BACT|nr:hypothetical protein [Neolewinella litorea]THH37898.1 hypothetical protein E4021_12735 [Neolewinella litorea]